MIFAVLLVDGMFEISETDFSIMRNQVGKYVSL